MICSSADHKIYMAGPSRIHTSGRFFHFLDLAAAHNFSVYPEAGAIIRSKMIFCLIPNISFYSVDIPPVHIAGQGN